MSEVELEPCPVPWCGSTADFAKVLYSKRGERGLREGFHAECLKCGLSGPVSETREEAAKPWNTRAPVWTAIEDVPKNRTPFLAHVRDDLVAHTGRADLEGWAGRWVVVQHPGLADDGFDVGWSVAAPVGHGGLSDDWFDRFLPLPPDPPKGE